MIIPYSAVLNVKGNNSRVEKIACVAGDTNAYQLNVDVVIDDEPVNLTGHTAKITFVKPDGTTVFQDMTIDDAVNGKMHVLFDNQAYAAIGTVKAEIKIYSATQDKVTIGTFAFNVKDSLLDDGAVESTTQYTALDVALAEVTDFVNTKTEVTNARGANPDLKTRLDNVDTQISQKANQSDLDTVKTQIASIQAYGVRYKNSTDTMTRIGNAVGKVANANGGLNDFDSIMPWSGMRRCNLADNLNVNAYYGDVNYKEDGSNDQVMVEVPALYYKRTQVDADTTETYISMLPLAGYKLHPWFYDINGKPRTKAYISAYEGSIFDVSASAYLINDEQVADFTVSTGDKLCSIVGAKPCSGLTQNLIIGNSRILATNRGSGWQQLHFNTVSAIQMLFMVEYASLNSQSKVGQGVVNIVDDASTNQSVVTGTTSSLGNKSGKATGTDGLVSVAYRGIENFWGNMWSWVDGLNIQNQKAFINKANENFVSDKFTDNYVDSGILIVNANGYVSKVGLNYNFDYGSLPTEVSGTSSSKYCDQLWQNSSGAFIAAFGGRWYGVTTAGMFCWELSNGSGLHSRTFGARLCA